MATAKATAVCTFLMVMILFVPPYTGVANDSFAEKKMQSYGLTYQTETDEEISGNDYFTRVYQKVYTDEKEFISQALLVKIAEILDDLYQQTGISDRNFSGSSLFSADSCTGWTPGKDTDGNKWDPAYRSLFMLHVSWQSGIS